MKLAKTSIALLVIQLAIVSTVAAKYLYQRSTCPRVWTRAAAYDPELVMRGRYLSLQLTVDGCESTLPFYFPVNCARNRTHVLKSRAARLRTALTNRSLFDPRSIVMFANLPAVHSHEDSFSRLATSICFE